MTADAGRVVLVSCYELGRQPLGIAVPAAHLRRAGIDPVVLDLAARPLDDVDEATWSDAALVAVSVPMHTALSLAMRALPRIRSRAPRATVAFHGLYAALNAAHLLGEGVDAVLAGESDAALVDLARRVLDGGDVHGIPGVRTARSDAAPVLARLDHPVPDRAGLPDAPGYAALDLGGERRRAAAIESTRGCKHLCAHCPIPPVYGGRFFAVPVDTVVADVRNVVDAGARHLTFADPDFLNGPTHALRVTEAIHERWPDLTFDFTAKVEHLLDHSDLLSTLAARGAVFAVTAVESLNADVLRILDKGHDPDGAREAVAALRRAGIAPRPSLMPFSPWETRASYGALLDWIAEDDLVEHVDPVHLSIRLLVPPGSLLERDPALAPHLRGLDAPRLQHRWEHPDPAMDGLQRRVEERVRRAAIDSEDPWTTFAGVVRLWRETVDEAAAASVDAPPPRRDRVGPPRLTEAWFC